MGKIIKLITNSFSSKSYLYDNLWREGEFGVGVKIKEIFNLAIQMGIRADFRGEDGIKKFLDNKKKKI